MKVDNFDYIVETLNNIFIWVNIFFIKNALTTQVVNNGKANMLFIHIPINRKQ